MKSITPWVTTLEAKITYKVCQCLRCATAPWANEHCSNPVEINKTRKELIWICSCGGSKNLPYCDGTHNPRHNMTVLGTAKEMWHDFLAHFKR